MVYNQYMDTMKEFKAQSIDIAEAIRRVSDLFRERKDLDPGPEYFFCL